MCVECAARLESNSREMVKENVNRGIEWMNKNASPDWKEKIDLDSLDINNAKKCVLGQAYEGGYHQGQSDMYLQNYANTSQYGMAGDFNGNYNNEWKRRIKEELELAVNA